MNETLRALRERALRDPQFRQALLRTRESDDPLESLCAFAVAHGYTLTPGDVISDGEEFACNQMKSTNGGNPLPYDCFGFADAYEMFFFSLM